MNNTKYIFDYETSKAVYERNKKYVEQKMCYNNIFHVITNEMRHCKENNWKVAYGYISIDDDNRLYARHCFLLDGNNVIDPTIIVNHEGEETHREYLVFKVFDTYKEYINAIEHEKGYYPALENTLRKQDLEFCKKGVENGLFFI